MHLLPRGPATPVEGAWKGLQETTEQRLGPFHPHPWSGSLPSNSLDGTRTGCYIPGTSGQSTFGPAPPRVPSRPSIAGTRPPARVHSAEHAVVKKPSSAQLRIQQPSAAQPAVPVGPYPEPKAP